MEKIFESRYFLTPAECSPEGRMPITLLINRLIEVATLHANSLGIGYASLVDLHQTWVLSRVAVEMTRYPGVNDHYTVRTWVCSLNRLFSERDFEILDGEGATIGWARTVWAVMDTQTRTVADISRMAWITQMVPDDKVCPVAKSSRPVAVSEPTSVEPYRFTYCDLDFNRHVNSSRYTELLLNQWTLDFHDAYRLTRFEIAYIHEAYFDQQVEVRLKEDTAEGVTTAAAEILADGAPLCRAKLEYRLR